MTYQIEAGLLANKTVLVTGGGRGIGRAIVRAFAQAGATVIAASRNESELQETVALVEQDGRQAVAMPVDVTNRQSVEWLTERIHNRYGPVDVLVNSAGSFAAVDPVWEVDPDLWLGDLMTNLYGTFLCSRAVLPSMIERQSGTIITMSGGGAAGAYPFASSYASSKAGVLRFTDSVAAEVAPYNIYVYALEPGLVRTAMTEGLLRHPKIHEYIPGGAKAMAEGRTVSPDLSGKLAVFLATLKDRRLSGRSISVTDDYTLLVEQADKIVEQDLRTLRIRR